MVLAVMRLKAFMTNAHTGFLLQCLQPGQARAEG